MEMRIFDRLAPLRRAEARGWLTRNVLAAIALALMFINCAASQQLSTALDSNAIMGFETPAGWNVTGNNATIPTESPTTTRTQGKSALAVTTPSNLTKLTSMSVASTATALAGVGNSGASFEIDVMLPAQQGNPSNSGQLQLLVNSPSRGLSKVLVGGVTFSSFRLGIYNTMKIPIPAAIGSALGAASFSDLTFQFLLSSPGTGQGTYLFDNLRVHSVALVTADASTKPPVGYGGSVDFVVFGGTPEAQLFDASPVQVPDSFHLKLGTAGATTVQLDLGYDGTPSFTCTYDADTTDATGKSYMLQSCTGGIQAGDLIGASWAKLTIVGGDPSMKLRAQLARNPVGDLTGAGIIPAMPTFWGDFDGCVPVAAASGVQPPFSVEPGNVSPPWILAPSTSCAAQTTQANQIVTDYFNKVKNDNFPHNWIVTPTPELARRHGNATWHNNLTGPPPTPSDPDFDEEDDINPGGDWNAYYKLVGNLNPTETISDISIDFNATMEGHAVLYGEDVNVVTIQLMAHADVSPLSGSPSGSGSVHVFVFGGEIPTSGTGSGGSVDPSVGFDVGAGSNQDYTGITIQIWIFEIEVDASTSMGLDATGKLVLFPPALNFSFGPVVSMGVHAFGGVNFGLGSGGVDVTIDDLFHAELTANADATLAVLTDPRKCDAQLNYSADVAARVFSGGGRVNLVASLGKCPFCWDDSWEVFNWPPLFDTGKVPIFDSGQNSLGLFELPSPTTTCSEDLTRNITITSPTNGGIYSASIAVPLAATAKNSFINLDCTTATFDWSVTPPDTLQGQGCSATGIPTVTFNQTGMRTVNLKVTYKTRDLNGTGTQITETGTGSATVTVNALAGGPHITCLALQPGSLTPCANPVQVGQTSILVDVSILPSSIELIGVMGGLGSTATTTTWTVMNPDGTTTTLTPTPATNTVSTSTSMANWTFAPVPNGGSVMYQITMRNSAFASADTLTVTLNNPPH